MITLDDKIMVDIPGQVREELERLFVGDSFPDIDALLRFVLAELTRDDARRLDEAEQAVIEQRLKDLGYF